MGLLHGCHLPKSILLAETLAGGSIIVQRRGHFVDAEDALPKRRPNRKPPDLRRAMGRRTPESGCLGHPYGSKRGPLAHLLAL